MVSFPPACCPAAAAASAANEKGKLTDLLHRGALEAGGGEGGVVLDALGVVGLAEVEAEVVQVLALGEVMVIGIGQERRAHPPDEGLGESVVDVEGGHVAGGRLRCRGRHLCVRVGGCLSGLLCNEVGREQNDRYDDTMWTD